MKNEFINKNNNKAIHCSVNTCQYIGKNNICTLNEIQVAPSSNVHDGTPDHESMCASYKFNNNK